MIVETFSVYHLEFFLMIFARIAGTLALAPIFGAKGIPRRVRVGLALCMAMLIMNVTPYEQLEYTSVIGFGFMVAKELVTGLILGFISNIAMTIISFSGTIIDTEIGFSMVSVFDPLNNTNTTISGEFYNYLVLLVLLCSNLHYFILSAVADSFKVIPVGQAIFDGETFYNLIVTFMTDYFLIGIRIALPVFVAITLLNVVLGVLAKVAPQLNMFVVGMQLKVFTGFAVLIVVIAFLPTITSFLYTEVETIVDTAIRGMY